MVVDLAEQLAERRRTGRPSIDSIDVARLDPGSSAGPPAYDVVDLHAAARRCAPRSPMYGRTTLPALLELADHVAGGVGRHA